MAESDLDFYLAGEIDNGNPNSISVSELEELKQLSNLTYIGTLNIEKELHNYDISIIMSRYEGFSRILLESLYVGLFCISNKGIHLQRNPECEYNRYLKFNKSIQSFGGSIYFKKCILCISQKIYSYCRC